MLSDDISGRKSTGATLPVEHVVSQAPSDGAGLQTAESASLIRLATVRSDPRFAGIDGSGYSVVVIDTGVDLDHSAFGPDTDGNGVADRIVFEYDFSGSNDADASDTEGHGTHVAGIVGSQNASYLGVAPAVNLIILKVFPDYSDSASIGDIVEAAQWVVDNALAYNIVSVNLSLGAGNFNSAQTTFLHDEFQAFIDLGIAPVVAAGNSFFSLGSSPGVGSPAADSLAWGVGAVYDANIGRLDFVSGATDFTTAPDRIASFTQRTTTPGLVDILAPGGAITNAYLGNASATFFGTSMAAPHIAGIVALAQEYAVQLSGSRLPVDTLLGLMQASAVTVIDGDDENDNVANTGGSYPRVDVLGLLEAILGYFGGGASAGSVSIADVSVVEGDTGTQVATFTVTRTGGIAAFNLSYATADGSGSAGSDYVATSGSLAFAAGVDTRTISVVINGDTTIEADETFLVTLSGATGGAVLADSQGLATIVNNDGGGAAGSISIDDTSVTEGDSGTRTVTFTVTRTGGAAAFSVDFATADGSAAAGTDYAASSGTLAFGSGVATQTIVVTVNGDRAFEPNETFFVNLSGATNGATISDGQGRGTIVNDDTAPPSDDFADGLADTTSPFGLLGAGGALSGSIETIGDRDWFRLSLTAGVTYTIDLQGADTAAGTLSDPYLSLYDHAGLLLRGDDDSGAGLNARLVYTPGVSGTYYLDAGAFSDSGTGTYRASLAAAANAPPTDIALSRLSIAENSPNGTIVGTFSASDPDPNESFTYSLLNNAGGRFAISGANLVVSGPLDYEAARSHDVTVRVVDSANHPLVETFTIGVQDLPDDAVNAVFRFFDMRTGHHFYTPDPAEKAGVLARLPWFTYEGAAWATPDKSVGTVDVFRFFDARSGDHFYTSSVNERDGILATLAHFTFEGVAFQAYANASQPGTFALERFFNRITGEHHFAAGASESAGINAGAAGPGWIDEGPGFVVHQPTAGMLLL